MEHPVPKKKDGCWGTRGWGFHPKDGKKPQPSGESPRDRRDRINGYRKD